LHQPVERELGPGQTDVFTVQVAAGQFLHVVTEKKGVDVVVLLADPRGTPVVAAGSANGSANGKFGPEPISLVAGGGGDYQVQVLRVTRSSETGRYCIELTDLRAPTERDRIRLHAESEFFAAVAGDRTQNREKRLQAIAGYQRAAALWHSLRDDGEVALCLYRIGLIYSYNDVGERQKALDYYNQALPLLRVAGDRAGEAMTLTGIGGIYLDLGEKQKALDYYNQALPQLRAMGNRTDEAFTLRNIGNVYSDLGQKQKALDYYNQALPLYRAEGDRAGEAVTLRNIGSVSSDLGQKQKALDYHNQTQPLEPAVGGRTGEVISAPVQSPPRGSAPSFVVRKAGKLALHQPVERESETWQLDLFTVDVPAGLFLHVEAEKKGMGVLIVLRSPQGKSLVTADSLNGEFGPQPASLIADVGGEYQIGVANVSRGSGKGRYRIELTDLHVPTEQDRTRLRAETEFFAAVANVRTGDGEKRLQAVVGYQRAAALWHSLHDDHEEAVCLQGIGNIYYNLAEKKKALDYYNQALPLKRAVGDRAGEAETLNSMGAAYSDLGEKQKALDYYSQALPLRRVVGDRAGEARTLTGLGAVYLDRGEKQKALDCYNQALALFRAVGDIANESAMLVSIGIVYSDLGETEKAVDYYNQALPPSRAAGNRGFEARALGNIGNVFKDLGEKRTALCYYNQALPLFRAVGDRAGEAMTLAHLGEMYSQLGEKGKALDYLGQALPLARAAEDRATEAGTLADIGSVYSDLGDDQKALDYDNQSLALSRAVGDRATEAVALNNIGHVYSGLGEKGKALDFYNLALPLMQAAGNRAAEAVTLRNIGNAYSDLGQKQKALDFYNQAIPLERAGRDRAGEAATLYNTAIGYSDLGEKGKAPDYQNQAPPLGPSAAGRKGEATVAPAETPRGQTAPPFVGRQAGKLVLHQPVERELGPKQVDVFTVSVSAGQFMHLVAEKKGVDAVVLLADPQGKSLVTADSANGAFGSQPASLITNSGGEYLILVVYLPRSSGTGRYRIELTDLHAPTEQDRTRLRAETEFFAAVANDRTADREKRLQAVVGYQRAAALWHSLHDDSEEAVCLHAIGSIYSNSGETRKALDYYNQALPLERAAGDRTDEALTLNNIGIVYSDLGDGQRALDYYNQALPLRRVVEDRAGEAATLTNIGTVYMGRGESQKALDYYNQALPLERAMGDHALEAGTLSNIGAVYRDLGEKQKALDYHNQALPLRRAVGDRAGEAATLINMGVVYSDLGEEQEALDYFNQALPLSRAVGNRAGEATTLNNIGGVYSALGEKQKALEYYNQALLLDRAVGARAAEAGALGDIGSVYSHLGEQQKALDYFNQALLLSRAVGDRAGEARTLNNIGGVHSALGEKQKALEYYSQALPLSRAVGARAGEATILDNIGSIYRDLGEKQKALDYHNQALPLERAAGDRTDEAITLNNIGNVYSDIGEKQKALDYYSQALPLSRAVGDRASEAGALSNIGNVYSSLGEKPKALGYYTRALPVAQAVSSPSIQGHVLSNLMHYWQTEYPGLAIFFGKQAINQYQDLRRYIQGLETQLQRSYLATIIGDYRSLVDLLIAQGRLSEAEQVLSLLKEREYFDYVRRDAAEASAVNGRANLNPEEAEWDRRYREIADRLVAIGTERGDLLAKRVRTPEETLNLDQLEKDIAVGNLAFEKFLGELAQRFSDKPMAVLQVGQLRETEGLMEDLRELPPGTVAIYTLAGEDKFRSILRTSDVQKAYEYPIRAADLNRKVLAFRQVAQNPKLDPRPLAEELYKILVGPMAEDLRQAKAKTLMWSLDGVLRYLPLAALYDGKQYLIERYRVSVMTLASNARLKDRPDAEWKGAGFGVTRAYEGAPALPWVSAELAGIIATKPGDAGVLAGEIELDDAFTQQAMRQLLLKRYPVVHIASHFRFQPGNETQSFLLLGDGGHLSLAELKTSANLFGGVQLLTLSACNTGMGDGTEVEGFGTLAQRQGAKAVIASLWPVVDQSTSVLMQRFYRIRESSPGKTKLEALREAQLELLRGMAKRAQGAEPVRILVHEPEEGKPTVEAPRFPVDPEVPYAHPYYWAPFFLMGNWL
jgi:tetratricopeptide (TPR) repeat protein/CHAT domain-containing protein